MTVAFNLLIAYPVLMLFVKKPAGFFKNIISVLAGKRTWVGYCKSQTQEEKLPAIKKGVLNPANSLNTQHLDDATLQRLNLLYARDYKISTDIDIILKGFRHLGSN